MLVLLSILSPVYSQMMLQPVASVNLIRPQMVTREELDLYKTELQIKNNNQPVSDDEALEVLINDILVLQGAERAGIGLAENDLNSLVAGQKESVEAQLGRAISDMDFAALLLQAYNMTIEDLKDQLKKNYLMSTYIRTEKSEIISSTAGPTNDEISNYYRKNAASFINPEYVHISHIFVSKNDQTGTNPKEKADSVKKQLTFNQKSFDTLVLEVSQDESSKFLGGDIGWFSINDETNRLVFGDNFIDAIFSLETGNISEVLESNAGYHIVKVLEHKLPKLLTLNEQLNPENAMTYSAEIN